MQTDFLSCGKVDITQQQRQKIALALSGSRSLRECFSHVEGGNILLGTLPSGERYGLVGRDSVALTQALLARDTMQFTTRRRAMFAIAKDYGLEPTNLFAVEQPGDFHLDMSIALLGPGQVVLNDSREAAELEVQWMFEDVAQRKPRKPDTNAPAEIRREYNHALLDWRKLRIERRTEAARIFEHAETRARYEALAYRDLLDAKKLTVYRMAGRFGRYLSNANFLSDEGGTNPAGEAFFVTQGGDPRAIAYVATTYIYRIPSGLVRIYFLDAQASADSGENWAAGLGCRVTSHCAIRDTRATQTTT